MSLRARRAKGAWHRRRGRQRTLATRERWAGRRPPGTDHVGAASRLQHSNNMQRGNNMRHTTRQQHATYNAATTCDMQRGFAHSVLEQAEAHRRLSYAAGGRAGGHRLIGGRLSLRIASRSRARCTRRSSSSAAASAHGAAHHARSGTSHAVARMVCARVCVWVGWGAPTGEQTGEFLTLLDLTDRERSERPSDCENKTTSCTKPQTKPGCGLTASLSPETLNRRAPTDLSAELTPD